MEDNVGILGEFLDLLELVVAADDGLHAELGLESFGLVGIADEGGDLDGGRVGALEELSKNSPTEVA